jgi:hypothetical protein
MTKYDLERCLINKYKGHDITFWKHLQLFHDSEENWNIDDNCISKKGKQKYQELLEKYKKSIT